MKEKKLRPLNYQPVHMSNDDLLFKLVSLPYNKVAQQYDIINIRPLYTSPMHQTTSGSLFLMHYLNTHKGNHQNAQGLLTNHIKFPKNAFVIFLYSHYKNKAEYVLVRNNMNSANTDNIYVQCDFYNTGFVDIMNNMPYATMIFPSTFSFNNNPTPSYMLHFNNKIKNMDYKYPQTEDTDEMFVNLQTIICATVLATMDSATHKNRHIPGTIGNFAKISNLENTPIWIKTFNTFINHILVEFSYISNKK